jgi:Cd2+/Zn2+-exporting ATPase
MAEITYRIQGLDCAEEVRALKGTVGQLAGIHDLRFDVLNGRMTVVFDPAAVTDAEIRLSVEQAGMKAMKSRRRRVSGSAEADCCRV